jgi:multidrug efflux pump subunit AcrA (membrane-fusion protein)
VDYLACLARSNFLELLCFGRKQLSQPKLENMSKFFKIIVLITAVTFSYADASYVNGQSMPCSIPAQGKLEELNPAAEVVSPIAGVVKKIYVRHGVQVKQGDLLMVIESKLHQRKEIRSPMAGFVYDLGLTPGTKVKRYQCQPLSPTGVLAYDLELIARKKNQRCSSQPLMRIMPMDNSLVAKVFITSKDISYAKVGLPVDIRIDSFPFSEFGDVKGIVEWISADALPPDKTYNYYRFPVTIKLNQQALKVANSDQPGECCRNYSIKLQTGMSINANINLLDRATSKCTFANDN